MESQAKFKLAIIGFDGKITAEIEDTINKSTLFLDIAEKQVAENNLEVFKFQSETKPDIVVLNTIGFKSSTADAISQIKEKAPLTEIILVSFSPNYSNAIRAFRLGARDVLLYPFKSRALTFSLERAVTYLTLYKRSDSLSDILGVLNRFGDSRKFKNDKHLIKSLSSFIKKKFSTESVVIFTRDNKGNCREWSKACEKETKEDFSFSKDVGWIELEKNYFPYTFIEVGEKTRIVFYLGKGTESSIYCSFVGKCDESDFELIGYLARLIQTSFQYKISGKNETKLLSLAHTDDVTGLYNQRRLQIDLDYAIEQYERDKSPFTVIFIDIDHFKAVNDSFGHLSGSLILTEVAKVLKAIVRESDYLYRYGGDEFVTIIPNTNSAQGKEVGHRILEAIKMKTFLRDRDQNIRLTVSIGISEFPKDSKNKEEVLAKADEMMYKAKEAGRGRVCLS